MWSWAKTGMTLSWWVICTYCQSILHMHIVTATHMPTNVVHTRNYCSSFTRTALHVTCTFLCASSMLAQLNIHRFGGNWLNCNIPALSALTSISAHTQRHLRTSFSNHPRSRQYSHSHLDLRVWSIPHLQHKILNQREHDRLEFGHCKPFAKACPRSIYES